MLPILLPRRRLAAAVAVAALALPLALTGCGEDDEPAGAGAGGAAPAAVELPPSLTADWSSVALPFSPVPLLDLSSGTPVPSDVAVARLDRRIAGYDLATGTRTWTLDVPRGESSFCAVSPQVSATGYVGVLLAGRGHPCSVAGAVDVATGELAWTRVIPGRGRYFEGREVAVSGHTLVATLYCDAIVRYGIDGGRPLGSIAPPDRKCANETVTDGISISVLSDPETAATPDDHGTGFIPADDVPGAFRLYDADTGRLRWSRPVATTRGAGTSQILSEDPLVVVDTEGGATVARIVGRDGRSGAYLGKTLPLPGGEGTLATVVGQGDGVLVLRYPGGADPELLFGYDLRTGRERWHLDLAAPGADGYYATADVLGDRLVLATPTYEAGDQGAPGSTWVTSRSVGDLDDVRTVGRVEGSPSLLAGSRLVTTVPGAGSRGYTLPATGEARAYDPPAVEGGVAAPAWADGDLRPAQVQLACEAVTARTLALVAIRRGDLPPPADCRWDQRTRPTSLERQLDVTVTAWEPEEGRTASGSARSAARQLVGELRGDGPGSSPAAAGEVPEHLTGLGDESWVVSPAGSLTVGNGTALVTRYRNVVVEVEAGQDVQGLDALAASVPEESVDAAAVAATLDVLRGLGATGDDVAVRAVPAGAGGTTRAPSTCDLADDVAAVVVPGARGRDLSPTRDRRRSACRWSTERYVGDGDYTGSRLEVTTHVVGPSPLGLAPGANARRFADLEVSAPFRRLPGLAGRTSVYRYDGGGGYRAITLTHVRGDVITVVDYTVASSAPPLAEMQARALRVARAVGR